MLGLVGDLCRSMLIPAPGHRFIIGDFSAIEARVLAFLAGDADKLERFPPIRFRPGRDLYCVTAEQVLGLTDVQDKSPERQLGKIFELGLGYSMGGRQAAGHDPEGQRPQHRGHHARGYRALGQKMARAEPRHRLFWAALNAAAVTAVRNPEIVVPCRAVSFFMREGVLFARLPSGRELSYPTPVIEPGRFGARKSRSSIWKRDASAGKQMYGGTWAENVTSAVARDLLVEAMKRLRAAGYALVLHTHDEIVAEMPTGEGSVEEFKRLLVEVPDWAQGLPIAAKVFECNRFKKD